MTISWFSSPRGRQFLAAVGCGLALLQTLPATAQTATAAPPSASAASSAAPVLTLAGVRIEPSVSLAGSSLPLHGAGIRSRFFIKVYTAALYVAGHADSVAGLMALPDPKRMQITMLRGIDSNELGRLFTEGMERNTPRGDMARSINGTIRMGELFAKRKRLQAGDTFSVDWTPGTGAQVLINGRVESDTIPEPEFFAALLSIWLGPAPADDDLKAALLGKTGARRPATEP